MSIEFPVASSMDDLVAIAVESDDYIFRSKQYGNYCQDMFTNELVAFCSSSSETPEVITATALLALNALESSVRLSTGFTTGRAPLLMTMIESIPDQHIGRACQLLLLAQGLNLRNLIWHGYVSNLPRPWLALVLVLNSALLQGACNSIERSTANIIDLRSVPQLKGVFDFKVDIQENSRAVQAFLPQSHHGLWHLAVKWYTERVRPVSTAALLCTLLEHGLRLEWCRYNHRPSDRIARPGVFYVTLDGHGQRHVHDLLLHPYMMNDSGRNLLVENLPGSTTAILTDMFCSSCGGPNIRSTISHGVWDSFLADEWNQTKKPDEQTLLLWDTAEAVMVSMMWSSLKKPMPYCPVFSYAATTRRNLLQAQRSIQVLEQAQSSEDYIHFLAMATNMFGEVPEDIASLQSNGSCHSSFFHGEQSQTLWRSVDVFDEHELNKSFGNAGAARCLLQDIASATNDHVAYLHEALTYLASPQGKASKRAHRRSLRIVYSSQVAVIFYTFAVRVAMICLRQEMGDEVMVKRSTLLKAVERSRMVVSTVKRFLHSNADRAIKSIKEYTKGRAIKDVISLGNKLT